MKIKRALKEVDNRIVIKRKAREEKERLEREERERKEKEERERKRLEQQEKMGTKGILGRTTKVGLEEVRTRADSNSGDTSLKQTIKEGFNEGLGEFKSLLKELIQQKIISNRSDKSSDKKPVPSTNKQRIIREEPDED